MYHVIKTVIEQGRYELNDLLEKMDQLWLQQKLNDAQRAELMEAARAGATPQMGYQSMEKQMQELRLRVEILENKLNGPVQAEDYPAWKQPTCAQDAYYAGDGMTWTDGECYRCIAPEGFAVTYGPDALPAYWQKVMA